MWDLVQSENAEPLVENVLRISRWQQKTTPPGATPFWAQGSVGVHSSRARRAAVSMREGEHPPEAHIQTKGKGVVYRERSREAARVNVIGWLKQVFDFSVQDWLVVKSLLWANF